MVGNVGKSESAFFWDTLYFSFTIVSTLICPFVASELLFPQVACRLGLATMRGLPGDRDTKGKLIIKSDCGSHMIKQFRGI